MTLAAKVEPIGKMLKKSGWQVAADRFTWTHPERSIEKIAVDPMSRWTHLKVDITAPHDYRPIAAGIGIAELKKYLISLVKQV
jgi:hypothetical protein